MSDWRVARMFVLGTLVIGLGGIVYRQGFGWQLGGAPASLETAWQTEEAWIAGAKPAQPDADAAHDIDIQRVLGPRLEYDLRAIGVAIDHVKGDDAVLALRARSCELAVAECARYASALARMDRADEAARLYERTFARGWKRWLRATFPDGLQPAAATAPTAPMPARGVTVTKDNDRLRKAGLQAGDLIVGLEGWRVDNLKQFYAINAFFERPDRTLTVWRGRIYEVKLPWRAWYGNGVQFRSYPIQGWAE